jgi:hypothetical protein
MDRKSKHKELRTCGHGTIIKNIFKVTGKVIHLRDILTSIDIIL